MVKKKEETQSDSEWVRESRLEDSHNKYFWARIRRYLGWVTATSTTLWAGYDAFSKLMEKFSK